MGRLRLERDVLMGKLLATHRRGSEFDLKAGHGDTYL